MIRNFFSILFLSLMSLFSAQITADSIRSKSLNETVKISIYLPKNYTADAATRFPVIYLLDSEINMPYFAPMMEFQKRSYKEKGQAYIVVGIEPKSRTMNYTPTKSSVPDPNNPGKILFSDSGGAEDFTKFLQDELKPKIEQMYRTNGFSVLCGHSFGGLFTLNLLLKHPDYFHAYIADDPSFWWDNSYLTNKMAAAPKFTGTSKPFVFLALAGEKNHKHGFEAGQAEAAPAAENYLKNNAIPYKIVTYPEENHGTVSYKANFDALRELYKYKFLK